jgi:hypothetical protein
MMIYFTNSEGIAKRIGFTLALTLTLSPVEREQVAMVSGGRKSV